MTTGSFETGRENVSAKWEMVEKAEKEEAYRPNWQLRSAILDVEMYVLTIMFFFFFFSFTTVVGQGLPVSISEVGLSLLDLLITHSRIIEAIPWYRHQIERLNNMPVMGSSLEWTMPP